MFTNFILYYSVYLFAMRIILVEISSGEFSDYGR